MSTSPSRYTSGDLEKFSEHEILKIDWNDLLFDQAPNPVLLLQPDCPLCAHLLHGSPWFHSSTWLGGETHSRCSFKSKCNYFSSVKMMCERKSETGIHVQVCRHPQTCCIPAFFAFHPTFTNLNIVSPSCGVSGPILKSSYSTWRRPLIPTRAAGRLLNFSSPSPSNWHRSNLNNWSLYQYFFKSVSFKNDKF